MQPHFGGQAPRPLADLGSLSSSPLAVEKGHTDQSHDAPLLAQGEDPGQAKAGVRPAGGGSQ